MRFNTKAVTNLNNLLKKVQRERDEIIDVIISICPREEGDCDNQLEESREALNCEYFPLCNVLGSYALLTKEEQTKVDVVLDMFYTKVVEKGTRDYSMFS